MRLLTFSVWASTVLLTVSIVGWGQLAAAQNDTPTVSSRDFWASLTPNERKLPRDILAQHYLAEGKPVPANWAQAAQTRTQGRSVATSKQTFRLDGDTAEGLETVLSQIGAEAIARSSSRGYVTAQLSADQVLEASNYAEVRRIRYVKGPTAQGVTEAWAAHRVADLSNAAESGDTISTKPAITGDNVVIGLISLPYNSADLSALDGLSSRVIPSPENIIPAAGAAVSTGGTADLLNMLQVIYDIAPGATVVVGSPGINGTPAQMHTLIDQLVAGNGSVGGAGYIPPANIIVDDLDFLSQNPFEVDEVSEAIVAARAAGVLYVTAAGDGGHHESVDSTSNVYVADFNSQLPPNSEGLLGEIPGSYQLHMFPGNVPGLTVSQDLTDLCLFWNVEPGLDPSFNDLWLWTFEDLDGDNTVDSDEAIDEFRVDRPGGCISESLPAKTRLVLVDYNGRFTDRFMIVGERANTELVTPSITGAFDLSTPGAIRGHAYHPDALTVATTPYIGASNDVSEFSSVSPANLTVSDYSADGESSTQKRFYWQNVGSGSPDWQAIASGGLAAAKPDLTATANLTIKNPAGSETSFHGTSASAAVTAGIAALYWEFRQWQLNDRSMDGSEVSSEDILSIMRASVIDPGTTGWDRQFGRGVLDAPKALEIPLPTIATTLSVVPEDADSVSVSWIVDYLSDNNAATSTLNCSQNGISLITNQTDKGSGSILVTASDTSPVECTLSTAFTVDSVPYNNSTTPLTGSATPEALNTGLPIWLLYIATQPE